STAAGDHPNLATSTIDPLRSANRVWTLAPASAAGATWSATFDFAASDLDAAADPLSFIGRVWNGSAWSGLTMGTLTAGTTQVTGLNASTPGTQFALGNLKTFTIAASAGAGGSISPSGSVTVPMNGNQTFNITPNAGFGISDVQVDGSSVGAVTSYS